ncbi:MAG: hypothetical protein ACKPE6_01780 [Gammaproteobacteria bacterium]
MHVMAVATPRAGVVILVTWVLVTLAAGSLLVAMSLHDSLTSVADDSSNYLVMALELSPWKEADPGIRSVWPLQYFPPGFPLILALSGAAHSLLAAHALVLVMGLCSLPLCFRFGRLAGLGRGAAHATAMLYLCTPGFLLGLQGILSEALYLLLVLCALMAAETSGRPSRGWLLAGVLAALAFATRSVGAVLLLAMAAALSTQAFRRQMHLRHFVQALCLLAVPSLLTICIVTLSRPSGAGDYSSVWAALHARLAQADPLQTGHYLAAQLAALVDAWNAFLVLYWLGDMATGRVVSLLLLLVAVVGCLCRLLQNRADGWFVAGSLALLLIWPFPGQMMRFLFPLVPLLLVQAAWVLQHLASPRMSVIPLFAFALVAACVLPSNAFLWGRVGMAYEAGLVPVYEWLRRPALAEAQRDLLVQNAMLTDMHRLRELPPPAVVATHEPSYVALLAGIPSLPIEQPLTLASVQEALRQGATHVYLGAIHPRKSRQEIDGMAIAPEAAPFLSPVWCSYTVKGDERAGCLYVLRAPLLDPTPRLPS